MRTTLILNDELIEKAKKMAIKRKTTLGEIVNDSLRLTLEHSKENFGSKDFRITPFNPNTSMLVDTSPHDFVEMMVAEETEPYLPEES